MKKKRSRTKLLIAIMLMLILVLICGIWIIHRGHELKAQREQQERELAQQEEQQKAEEEAAAAAAEKDAEEAAIASHVYSHRGSAGPEEHSFKAYDAALEAGAQNVDLDIVISSDGELYVSHDLNAVTMTGYNGMYEYMSSETIDSLKTEAGNKILRLSEVFDKYGKDVLYTIELKPNSDACIEAFEKVVDEYGFEDVIIVQSLYPDVLETLEEKYPDMQKLYVAWSQADFEYVLDKDYADIISVKASAGLMTEANCEAAHDNGKLFSAWTLDSEETIRKAIDMGVDTYFTNDTPLALKLEREYGLNERKSGGQ